MRCPGGDHCSPGDGGVLTNERLSYVKLSNKNRALSRRRWLPSWRRWGAASSDSRTTSVLQTSESGKEVLDFLEVGFGKSLFGTGLAVSLLL